MAKYLEKRQQRHRDIIDSYYLRLNEAEKFREMETNAAITIQKYWFNLKYKWKRQDENRACLMIQRIWRGYNGRCKFMNKKQEEDNYKQSKFFNEQARIIQKFYRGFYSRKYEHDFYARKAYLHHVQNKNEEVRK